MAKLTILMKTPSSAVSTVWSLIRHLTITVLSMASIFLKVNLYQTINPIQLPLSNGKKWKYLQHKLRTLRSVLIRRKSIWTHKVCKIVFKSSMRQIDSQSFRTRSALPAIQKLNHSSDSLAKASKQQMKDLLKCSKLRLRSVLINCKDSIQLILIWMRVPVKLSLNHKYSIRPPVWGTVSQAKRLKALVICSKYSQEVRTYWALI